MSDFTELGIGSEFCERLAALGISEPTEIQRRVIPPILDGKNVIFQSATGSGKTFAFLLPLLQRLQKAANPEKAALIVLAAPTFELASQLRQAASSVTELKTGLFIGGVPLKRQIDSLKEKPQIVVGTPSRLLELCRLKRLKTAKGAALVLDEADRLFSKEIAEETRELVSLFGAECQILACSATIGKKTEGAVVGAAGARKGADAGQEGSGPSKNGAFETILLPPEYVLREKIEHWALFAERRDKIDVLRSLLHALGQKKALVFSSRADQAENIFAKLQFRKIPCAALTARVKNQERQSVLARFKSGKIPVLVASDLSSRGLDIPDIDCIIQCDLPEDDDFFVHRAGRTARAGKSGLNVVIGDARELTRLSALEKKLKIVVRPKALFKGKVVAADLARPD